MMNKVDDVCGQKSIPPQSVSQSVSVLRFTESMHSATDPTTSYLLSFVHSFKAGVAIRNG